MCRYASWSSCDERSVPTRWALRRSQPHSTSCGSNCVDLLAMFHVNTDQVQYKWCRTRPEYAHGQPFDDNFECEQNQDNQIDLHRASISCSPANCHVMRMNGYPKGDSTTIISTLITVACLYHPYAYQYESCVAHACGENNRVYAELLGFTAIDIQLRRMNTNITYRHDRTRHTHDMSLRVKCHDAGSWWQMLRYVLPYQMIVHVPIE